MVQCTHFNLHSSSPMPYESIRSICNVLRCPNHCIIASLSHVRSFNPQNRTRIKAKGQDPDMQCVPNCSMLLSQHILANAMPNFTKYQMTLCSFTPFSYFRRRGSSHNNCQYIIDNSLISSAIVVDC